MNTYNINDKNYTNSITYQNFIAQNPAIGFLKIRAYAASQAIPISGLRVVVSKNIDNDNIIFFEGFTNESGVIERIALPVPRINPNSMETPVATTYDITTTYIPDDVSRIYKVNMYDNIYVVQNINIVPNMNFEVGGI